MAHFPASPSFTGFNTPSRIEADVLDLVHEGTMPEGTGQAPVGALVQIRPNLREVIERIEGVARQYPIRDSLAGQAMAMQREATIGAVRMAGMLRPVGPPERAARR